MFEFPNCLKVRLSLSKSQCDRDYQIFRFQFHNGLVGKLFPAQDRTVIVQISQTNQQIIKSTIKQINN